MLLRNAVFTSEFNMNGAKMFRLIYTCVFTQPYMDTARFAKLILM